MLSDNAIVPRSDLTQVPLRNQPPSYTRIPRQLRNQLYWVKQTQGNQTIKSVQSVEQQISFTFMLSNLDQSSTFTALFDCYSIAAVVCRFLPRSLAGIPTTPFAGTIYSCIDYDGNSGLSSGDIREFSNCLEVQATSAFTRIVEAPRISNALYNGSTFTGYGTPPRQWVDCSNASIPHYGLYLAWTAAGIDNMVLDVSFDYYIVFTQTR